MTSETNSSPELKHIFNLARLQHFSRETKAIWPAFDEGRFKRIAAHDLDNLGIMQRMRQVAAGFAETLPQDYAKALAILRELAPQIRHGFASIALAEFVVLRGMAEFDRSMEALRDFTQFGSAEFAIRHFLLSEPDRAIAIMRKWADHENEHVRRLASEGSRPRLPWSFQLKTLQANPEIAMPILEQLRADPSLYVRKSVANHLNDFSKDHPDWLVEKLANWDQSAPETQWIVRQAVRTLVKKGDARALALVGAGGKAEARVEAFEVSPSKIFLGDRLTIRASIISTGSASQKIVADYAVHYVKASGKPSRKVFKLKTLDLIPGDRVLLSISQTVKDFTTRKHFAGWHKVDLMLNGETMAEGGFELSV